MPRTPSRVGPYLWGAIALVLTGTRLLPLPVAATAAVHVPLSQSGYQRIHTTGAQLRALTHTVVPESGAIVSSTVWLADQTQPGPVRIRFGNHDWTACVPGAVLAQPGGPVSSYVCSEPDHGELSTETWIEAGG